VAVTVSIKILTLFIITPVFCMRRGTIFAPPQKNSYHEFPFGISKKYFFDPTIESF